MIDLSVKEIYTIVGVLMLLLAIVSNFKKRTKMVFVGSAAYLVLNYFLPKILFFDIVSFVVLITPFIYFRVNGKSFLD
tara:strand:- start:542 stop:775 length:234 start_codon:yes stop_codon:yes gene_type:complete